MSNVANAIEHVCAAPYDPSVVVYDKWDYPNATSVMPWIYTNWVDETLSWKKDCYLHTFLSGGAPNIRVKGPDAEKLMSDFYINSFGIDRFHVGQCKHCIAVTKDGYISSHGTALRVAEDEFHTYGLDPYVPMMIASGKYDVENYEIIYNNDFIFQLAGPKSLEIVENVIKEDVHDLKFMRFRQVSILGRPIRLLRIGMGRTLSYEFHGPIEDMELVYNEILRVGEKYNLHKMGHLAYMSNHTENGYPQEGIHFRTACFEDPIVRAYYGMPEDDGSIDWKAQGTDPLGTVLRGSMSDQGYQAYFLNPIEAGWGRFVHWDHDFQGKEALLRIKNDPDTRKVCTLEWNPEDILKIYNAFYDENEDIPDQMLFPQNHLANSTGQLSDKVVNENGEIIGRSACVVYTRYYKKSISMAFLNPKYVKEGQEVTVIWGTAGTRQIPIRAKVARYPYLDLMDNKEYDMELVPHFQG